MSDCELNVLINLDLIELNLEQVYIDSIQLYPHLDLCKSLI